MPVARIALLLAALIALVAVAVAVWRGTRSDPPVAAQMPPAASPQADVTTMIAQLEAKMKANPGDAAGWRMLGWSYYRTERFADAVNAYRRATLADPKNAEGWSALGEAISLAGKGDVPAEAEGAFRKALAIDPADPRARYFLAVRKDLSGDHKGAVDDWLALLKDTPPGAPWEENVRQTITQVAAKNAIDIAGRMPAGAAAPPAAGPNAATDAIPGPTREQMSAASALPPGQQDAMVRGMVDSLAAKLKANPADADGWLRLMRARMVLGDRAAATQALRDGTAAFPADKAAQAKLAEGARALGVPGA
ncbi:tetratricopeptide repeat protein [Sphingomonas profundi]|uniref:tetratricopeptide repeat protein n=1 Tax=Alterirhizorhabdus profundi TaxID=2681549 RepID=UPI001E58F34D|nr:tetratricopeptide repeat protein [Sphingomonas profundi]